MDSNIEYWCCTGIARSSVLFTYSYYYLYWGGTECSVPPHGDFSTRCSCQSQTNEYHKYGRACNLCLFCLFSSAYVAIQYLKGKNTISSYVKKDLRGLFNVYEVSRCSNNQTLCIGTAAVVHGLFLCLLNKIRHEV
jgi:hypothetical protein